MFSVVVETLYYLFKFLDASEGFLAIEMMWSILFSMEEHHDVLNRAEMEKVSLSNTDVCERNKLFHTCSGRHSDSFVEVIAS